MVDRSQLGDTLIIADRGYESYNLMAHIQEKRWFFLIRTKDVFTSGGIAEGLDLPTSETFDIGFDPHLTRRQTKEAKMLFENRNQYRFLPTGTAFDFLPQRNRKHDPLIFYKLPFRMVRFKITDNLFETTTFPW